MGCQLIYIFFVVWLKNLLCSFILYYICSKYILCTWIKTDLKVLKVLIWNFILKYFIINYLFKRYRFPRIFIIFIGILTSSIPQNILKSYGWWDLISDFESIYLLLDTYIFLLEELDTKRQFSWVLYLRLYSCLSDTPVFVTFGLRLFFVVSSYAWLLVFIDLSYA